MLHTLILYTCLNTLNISVDFIETYLNESISETKKYLLADAGLYKLPENSPMYTKLLHIFQQIIFILLENMHFSLIPSQIGKNKEKTVFCISTLLKQKFKLKFLNEKPKIQFITTVIIYVETAKMLDNLKK